MASTIPPNRTRPIEVERRVMVHHGRRGPNKVFGNDVDERINFPDQKAIERFAEVWSNGLRTAVERASTCTTDQAKDKLKNQQKALEFFDPSKEHREFKFHDLEFLAQLSTSANDTLILSQLWWIPSIDNNPRLLRVTFDTVREREYFKRLAQRLQWDDEALGKALVQDFIEKLKKTYPLEELVPDKDKDH